MVLAEGDHDRAGQRRQIDHELRPEALIAVPQRVAQHEATLCIRVQHLDGLPRHRLHDIAGPLRIAVDTVFNASDDADSIDPGLAGGQHVHQTDNGRRPSHIALHVFHPGRGFHRIAAGIEDDPLANEGDRLLLRLAALPTT